jgi:formylglycine-generating enzyme required for sulfatase activity
MKKRLMMIGAACLAAALTLAGCQSGPAPGGETVVAPKSLEEQKEMVLIPGGTFQMGSYRIDNEAPPHTVTISTFYIGKYEVTVGAFRAFMEASGYVTAAEIEGYSGFPGENAENGANWKNTKFSQTEEHPVVYVNFTDAVEYCNWLSEQEGLTPVYLINRDDTGPGKWGPLVNRVPGANGYRLPTEAEWEYAAKGGDGSPGNYTYAGSNKLGEVAWYLGNSKSSTHEVGRKLPNGLGLYDMTGNVDEWCWGWFDPYSKDAQTDPASPVVPREGENSFTILRGGAWFFGPEDLRMTFRHRLAAERRFDTVGFRVARSYQPE